VKINKAYNPKRKFLDRSLVPLHIFCTAKNAKNINIISGIINIAITSHDPCSHKLDLLKTPYIPYFINELNVFSKEDDAIILIINILI
jgi:hypothetical protein